MLEGIRVVTRNWIGRAIMTLVMGVLIVSFAIWGIGDMLRNAGSAKVGSVGGVAIPAERVRQAYQDEINRLQRQAGRVVTNEQARALGIDRQVVERIVSEMALDQKIAAMGLAISDDAIRTAIFDDPSFKDATGAFNRGMFQAALRDAGLTEDGFVREQRAIYLRREIGQAVAGDVKAPQPLLGAIQRYQLEARTVDVATLASNAAGEIADPSAEQLQAWFDQRKTNYRAPAYRKVAILTLRPGDVAKPAEISAQDVAAFYEREKAARFTRAEKRRALQIVYQTEDEAKAAAAKLAGGATFDALLAEKNLKEADVDLGLKSQADIFDKAVGAAIFALAPNGVSQPVKGDFGWVIVRLAQIEPGAVRPLAEVEADIRDALAKQRAATAIRETREKVEERRSDGKPLVEAGKDAGLTARVIDMMDAAGRDAKGQPIADLPIPEALVRGVFSSDVGADTLALPSGDGGYVWFDVLSVIPARDRTLDEVREQVLTEWRDEERARRLRAKGDAILTKAKTSTFDEAVKAEGLEMRTVKDVRRDSAAGLPAGVAAQIFNVKTGEMGSAATPEGGRMLFVVRSSVAPAFDPNGPVKQIDKELTLAISSDLVDQYVMRLKADGKVTLDQAAIARAMFGGGDAN
jgi:peptidyl-prolyl cis-trans isomerase D